MHWIAFLYCRFVVKVIIFIAVWLVRLRCDICGFCGFSFILYSKLFIILYLHVKCNCLHSLSDNKLFIEVQVKHYNSRTIDEVPVDPNLYSSSPVMISFQLTVYNGFGKSSLKALCAEIKLKEKNNRIHKTLPPNITGFLKAANLILNRYLRLKN